MYRIIDQISAKTSAFVCSFISTHIQYIYQKNSTYHPSFSINTTSTHTSLHEEKWRNHTLIVPLSRYAKHDVPKSRKVYYRSVTFSIWATYPHFTNVLSTCSVTEDDPNTVVQRTDLHKPSPVLASGPGETRASFTAGRRGGINGFPAVVTQTGRTVGTVRRLQRAQSGRR